MPIGRPITLTANVATKSIQETATAGQKEFTVTGGYRINELEVYRNGVRLADALDYTARDGSSCTLTEGCVADDIIEFHVFDSFNLADVISGNKANQTIDGNLTVTGTINGSAGINSTSNVGFGTTRPDSIARSNNSVILNAGIVTAYQLYGDGSNVTGVSISGINTAGFTTFKEAAFSGITSVTNTTASTSTTTGALVVSGGIGVAKSIFVGEGISVAGTITYNDVTNVDSIGVITAGKGLRATTGGLVVTAGNVKVTAGIASIGAGVTVSSDFIHLTDNSKIQLGIASDLTIQHNATNSVINNTTGQLRVAGDDLRLMNKDEDETYATFANDGAATLYYDNSKIIETVSSGASVYGSLKLQNGLLRENVKITAGKLSDNLTINVDNGMVHYFTTQESTQSIPNIISGAGINTDMAIGDTMALSVLTTAHANSFPINWRIDGVAASAGVTTYWNGGSAPSSGNSSGVDFYTLSFVKTASARYTAFANVSNFA